MTNFITQVIKAHYKDAEKVEKIKKMPMIAYIEKKTTSINSSSKARGSFGNIYAIYVLAKDYKEKGKPNYKGMKYKDFLQKQQSLPFGEKLQNHSVNSRCNKEFEKYFPDLKETPVLHKKTGKESIYKVNEKLLKKDGENITDVLISIIDRYVELKLEMFDGFIKECLVHKTSYVTQKKEAIAFIESLLDKKTDARIFEIVSFALTKYFHINDTYFIGKTKDEVKEVNVTLHKTGRTNANDGGIDFIMQPLGRIYQVTETLDFKKYFLDIDKLNAFHISFVIKTELSPKEAFEKIKRDAKKCYKKEEVLKRYLNCFEEVITIKTLKEYLAFSINAGTFPSLLDEIILQSKIEYNCLKR